MTTLYIKFEQISKKETKVIGVSPTGEESLIETINTRSTKKFKKELIDALSLAPYITSIAEEDNQIKIEAVDLGGFMRSLFNSQKE